MSVSVSVQNVSKRYRLGELGRQTFVADWKRKLLGREEPEDEPGTFWALRDLSFEAPQGQALAIIGRNGAGKSTLLKVLSSITAPTKGVVKLRGRVASLLEVGSGFHQDLTGRDNVFLNGAILGMKHFEIAARFDEIVGFSETGEFIDTPVKHYSSGMRGRLAFAVAAYLEAEILIVDEVLAVGDVEFQDRCLGKMDSVSRHGRTVLFVSHHAATIEKLCTRGIVLSHGKLEFDGSQLEALRFYTDKHLSAETCLRDRTDRTGSGEVRLAEIELRNLKGERIASLPSGEGLEVWLHYEAAHGSTLPRINCDLHITNVFGSALVTQSNSFGDHRLANPPRRGVIVCQIASLPLTEGLYRLKVTLFPSDRFTVIYDEMANAAEFRVVQTDFFGGGKGPLPVLGDGPFLLRGGWRIEEASQTAPAESRNSPLP